MHNKITIAILITALAGISLCNAQSSGSFKFYIKGYGGYGLLTPGSYKGNSPASNYSNFSTGKLGAGAGLHYGGGIGFIINDFLNAGIDLERVSGKLHSSTSSKDDYTYSSFSQKINYSVTSIIPNVTFKALSRPGYFIYTRVGIIIAPNPEIEFINADSSYSSGSGAVILTSGDEHYHFKINLGIQIAVGVQFNITEYLRGFAEIVGNILPASPVSSSQQYVNTSFGPSFARYSTTDNYIYTYKRYGSYSPSSSLNSTGGSDITESKPSITQDINYIGANIGIVLRL